MFNGISREEIYTDPKTGQKEVKIFADIRFDIEGEIKDWDTEVYRSDRIAAFRNLEPGTMIMMKLVMKMDDFSPAGKQNYRLFLDSFERAREKNEPKGILIEKDIPISPEDVALIVEDDYKNNRKDTDSDCMHTRLAMIKSNLGKEKVDEFYARYHAAVAKGESPSSYYQ